jgi:hypothetical protein
MMHETSHVSGHYFPQDLPDSPPQPGQWLPRRQRELSGELMFAAALFDSAARDLMQYADTPYPGVSEVYSSAYAWMTGDDEGSDMPFRLVCEGLDMDPDAVAEGVRRLFPLPRVPVPASSINMEKSSPYGAEGLRAMTRDALTVLAQIGGTSTTLEIVAHMKGVTGNLIANLFRSHSRGPATCCVVKVGWYREEDRKVRTWQLVGDGACCGWVAPEGWTL